MSHRRATPDHYARRAKREGHAARSVYKLEEIDKRWRLIPRGARVLELGAAPGSWLQYAAQRVGPQGHVLAIDLKPLNIALPAWTEVRQGDAFNLALVRNQRFDVVLSDMAPATMGDHKTDAARSANLAERALDLADCHLEPGGHVVVKVLEGGDMVALVQRMRATYAKVERLRPAATRKQSSEIFLIGLAKQDTTAPQWSHAPEAP